MNICMCGSQAGYPHASDCPKPLFRATTAQEDAWWNEREAKQKQLAQAPWTVEEILAREG
jgi:hypothetical protein